MRDYRVVDHGIEHKQYFTGHGVSLAPYTACATGCADSPIAALLDALEQLVTNGSITESDAARIETESYEGNPGHFDAEAAPAMPTEDHHYYLSVDIKD